MSKENYNALQIVPNFSFQPFCTEKQHHHASKQQCSPPPCNAIVRSQKYRKTSKEKCQTF